VIALAAALLVAGIPAAYGINRLADEFARRRADARRETRLRGRAAAVYVATPLLSGGCGLAFGLHPRVVVAVAFSFVLVLLAAIDAEQHLIPNRIVLPAALVVLAAQTAIDPSIEWIVASVAAAAFFLVAALAYPAGMGMGDVKLALLLGAMLGRGVVAGIFIGLAATVVPSVVILARHGARGRKMGLPLAPFLALGGAIALFAGRRIVDAYFGGFVG
jgi:leader peptidase (prepilin peptidase)/N-methyltransferase